MAINEKLLAWATLKLTKASIDYPQQEAIDLYQKYPIAPKYRSIVIKRSKRYPFAYLVGSQPFYRRNFFVNKSVLIPRPETEYLIELILKNTDNKSTTIWDCGTGSGAIAITLKKELPKSKVIATDISKPALKCAQRNARALHAKIIFRLGNLTQPLKNDRVDGVIANLPYVPITLKIISPELKYEPRIALFTGNHGLTTIKNLITQLSQRTSKPRWIWMEMLPPQINQVAKIIKHYLPGYKISIYKYLDNQPRYINAKIKTTP